MHASAVISYVPSDYVVMVGGLIIQTGGRLVLTAVTIHFAMNAIAISGAGQLIAIFGGVLIIMGLTLNLVLSWVAIAASGWGISHAGK